MASNSLRKLSAMFFFAFSVALSGCGGGGGGGGGSNPQNQSVAAPIFTPPAGTYSADQAVTISSSTAGAAIYYTTDGTVPTASSPVYADPISVAGNGTTMTIKAMAAKSGLTDSGIASATYSINNLQPVATPAFTPPAGTYSSDQSVAITSSTSGATIHYTTDGTAPTASSPVYASPISVAGNGTSLTIKAMAVKTGFADSSIASATYSINYTQTASPTFTPPAGTYNADQSVAISSSTSGATIYYTIDGTVPATSSSVYTAPISVAGNGTTMTIKALAVKAGLADSVTASATYTISYMQAAATPTFSPPGGIYNADQSVAISSSTSGATIHYTTNGTAPTTSSPVYTTPISVAGNGTTVTIKAIAVKSGMIDSGVVSATYTISYSQAATPTFSPPAGTYNTDQSIAISSSTSGATIHYTTNGTAPTTSSPVYTTPISVAGNGTAMTIKAMAVKPGYTNSGIASATYTINTSILFSYPPGPSGGLIQSSMMAPNNSDSDVYAYNDFTIASTQSITEVSWRGGYINGAPYGHVTDFSITFFDSTADGSQPLVTRPDMPETYLAKYVVGGDAGETYAGIFGGTAMYDYTFILPTPFQVVGGKKYWLRIEASQVFPDWGIAVGAGGDGKYFRFNASTKLFQMVSGGDTAFTLKK